jgi:hypothetical protein
MPVSLSAFHWQPVFSTKKMPFIALQWETHWLPPFGLGGGSRRQQPLDLPPQRIRHDPTALLGNDTGFTTGAEHGTVRSATVRSAWDARCVASVYPIKLFSRSCDRFPREGLVQDLEPFRPVLLVPFARFLVGEARVGQAQQRSLSFGD